MNRAAAIALLPASGLYWLGSGVHRLIRTRRRRRLPLPAVAVGGLTIGGEGKTPLASWIAALLREDGGNPAILMRGYGGDEQLVHRELNPGISVVCGADRSAAARRAVALGADSLVLDDAFQRTDLAPDLNVAVVAAEYVERRRLLVPAGRWREPITGLARAGAVVVTRRLAADAAVAELCDLAARCTAAPQFVARFEIADFFLPAGGSVVGRDGVAGRRVFAVVGIANPGAFFREMETACGALVARPLRDHHSYPDATVRRVVREARGADFVAVTLKDSVKLRGRWPAGAPPLLVARQRLRWEAGGEEFAALLRAAVHPGAADYIEGGSGTAGGPQDPPTA